MLLHLSDIHIGTEQPAVMAAVQALVQQHQDQIEAIAVSGDLTQRARESQFEGAKVFLESLNKPYLVVPGNHDIPLFDLTRRLLDPFENYIKYFGNPEQTLETTHFYLIGVNAVTRHHHTQGSLSPLQIWQVGERIRTGQATGKRVLVLSHQPYAVLKVEEKADIPRLASPALWHWSDCGLDMMLHGHFHQPSLVDLQARYGLSRPVCGVQAGTGLSQRLRYGIPNSVNLIHTTGEVERWDFEGTTGQMQSQGMLPLRTALN